MAQPIPTPQRQGVQPQHPLDTNLQGRSQGDHASSPTASLLSSSAQNTALSNFRLMSALRTGKPSDVQPYIDALKTAPPPEGDPGRLLGMAVRVAPASIIALILQNIPSPNLPIAPGTTTTALHVASETGRVDATELLLRDPRIDDTVRDEHGRTPLECAANAEVAACLEASRAALEARYRALLSNYVSSALSSTDEGAEIIKFLQGPRAEVVNLSLLDDQTGTSLLHEAARRRDLRLVELAVKRGADVFVRDRRGRRVLENDKGADERIKAYLKQFSNKESVIQSKSDGRPPDLKGFLSKWVNYRSGWRTRWFVLEDGVLSYYRRREDEQIACRGSIALATAIVHPSRDGKRFEVSSTATTSVPKISVKSDAPGEIARWVQAIKLNMEYYREGGMGRRAPPSSFVDKSDARSIKSNISTGSRSLGATLNEPSDSYLKPGLKRTPTTVSGISTRGTSSSSREPVPPVPPMPDSHHSSHYSRKRDPSPGGETTASDRRESDRDTEDGMAPEETVPHDSEFERGILNIKAQLEVTGQLVDTIVMQPDAARGANGGGSQQQVKDALRDSIVTLNQLVERQNQMAQDRERYFANRIKREVQTRKLWEDNLMIVAAQQADTDRQLAEAAKDNERKRRALRQAHSVLAEISQSQPGSPGLLATEPGQQNITGAPMVQSPGMSEFAPVLTLPPDTQKALGHGHGRQSLPRASMSLGRNSLSRQSIAVQEDIMAAIDNSEDDDDEFFDAIETGTIPNLRTFDSMVMDRPATPVGSQTAPPTAASQMPSQQAAKPQPQHGTISTYLARPSLEPYNHVRHRLPISDDKRPSVSLWSILKSSIGKDLTKISFPVSFNECTSMLQRMAEDMEYDTCLTIAAGEQDSQKRIAFVAAFAMSNYSSTIGRIAKPFNPMLSQSFEYALPNRYRYISEQVSHHPPISACYAEAPTWKYFGEVDAKNKFQGRYFEIRPTGVAHAELIIPKSWVNPNDNYPDAGTEYPEGYVVEHYSWKKVITNVSNFIMGNPIIDHYGDLVVTNHRTGETSTLTFKPRTWRGKDAFEIKGNVCDAQGHVNWDIAGRWDTQLIARRAGKTSEPLDSNAEVDDAAPEYMQLWKNTEKPKAPFNLTPFAVTLNDIPKGLDAYLAPTDCRMRTDQRAFENAEYDKAQMLKTANEEKQRDTRRKRAEGVLPPHEPQWFDESEDSDTGERLWRPKRDDATGEVKFWHDRELQANRPPGDKWPEVDHIFVEDADQ